MINDALAACDVIGVTRAILRLRHCEVAVGVGHGQPAEHVLVCRLAQRTFVLPLDPGPSFFIHVVAQPPTCAAGPGWALHVKWIRHNILTALQVCSQNEGCSLHPGDDGFRLSGHLKTCFDVTMMVPDQVPRWYLFDRMFSNSIFQFLSHKRAR